MWNFKCREKSVIIKSVRIWRANGSRISQQHKRTELAHNSYSVLVENNSHSHYHKPAHSTWIRLMKRVSASCSICNCMQPWYDCVRIREITSDVLMENPLQHKSFDFKNGISTICNMVNVHTCSHCDLKHIPIFIFIYSSPFTFTFQLTPHLRMERIFFPRLSKRISYILLNLWSMQLV